MRDKIWFMVIILGSIAAFAGAALSTVNKMTKPIIENRILNECVKPTLDLFYAPLNVDNDFIAEKLDLNLGNDNWGRKLSAKAFVGKKNDEPVAVALQTSKGGFGGIIQVLTVIDVSKQKLIGVKCLDQKETKGLGSRLADDKESFIKQFAGMSYQKGIKLKVDGGQVDTISGATVSSTAFTTAVNDAINLLDEHSNDILQQKQKQKGGK